MKRRPIVLLSLLALIGSAHSAPDSAYLKKLKKLKAEFSASQSKFFKELQQKPESEQNEFYSKQNPSKTFVKPALDLARSAGKDPAGADAYDFAITVLQSTSQNATTVKVAREAVSKYGKTGTMPTLIGLLGADFIIPRKDAVPMLQTIMEKSSVGKMRISATASLARLYKGWGEPKPADEPLARKYLNQLIAKWPKSPEAERAKGDLYELDNLRTGKAFPDFETTDQDGKSWKLSDYRGKVVVIDFWGYW